MKIINAKDLIYLKGVSGYKGKITGSGLNPTVHGTNSQEEFLNAKFAKAYKPPSEPNTGGLVDMMTKNKGS